MSPAYKRISNHPAWFAPSVPVPAEDTDTATSFYRGCLPRPHLQPSAHHQVLLSLLLNLYETRTNFHQTPPGRETCMQNLIHQKCKRMWAKDWSQDIKGSADGPCRGLQMVAHQHVLRCHPRNSLQSWFQIRLLQTLLAKQFCCWDLDQKAVSQPLNGVAVVMLPSNPSEPKLLNFQSLEALFAPLTRKVQKFYMFLYWFYTGYILSGCTSIRQYCSTSPFCCKVNCRSSVTWQKGFWKWKCQ